MSNILFLNLKRNGDIFNTASLAQSYLKEHPHATAYILTYEEFKKATKPLNVFKKTFTIDRKKITTFHNHNLYSNGFALDELLEELKDIESIAWSEVINFSSDKASTFLCNYLSASTGCKIKGIHFGTSNNINYTSNWEIVFNEVMTLNEASPVHFSTAYHAMAGVPKHEGPYNIRTINKHNDTVISNFNMLRTSKSQGDTPSTLVGIQLYTSQNSKNLPDYKLEELVKEISEEKNLIPLILIAPTEEERRLSKEFNSKFDNKLIVIESDFLALSSVLRGLDVLVTPDTSVKHLADLNHCKIIECTSNLNLSMKQGTQGLGNLILNNSNCSVKLIIDSIRFLIKPCEATIENILDEEVYITYADNLGWNLRPISGHFTKELFIRQLKRSYISSWCGSELEWDIKTYFSDYTYSEVQSIIDDQKSFVSEVGRDLLGTLRSLVKASDSAHEVSNFVFSLEKLLNHSESKNLASIAVIEFKALIENLNKANTIEQLRSAEELLYKLKKNLQITLECLNKVERDARSMPFTGRDKNVYPAKEINA